MTYGGVNNTYGSPTRRWGDTSATSTSHYIVNITETLSTIIESVGRSPLGGFTGSAANVIRFFGKMFNQRVTPGS